MLARARSRILQKDDLVASASHSVGRPRARPAACDLSDRRVCASFNSEDEASQALPHMKERFVRGQRADHILHSAQRCNHRHLPNTAGIDTRAAGQSGQFELRTNTRASAV